MVIPREDTAPYRVETLTPGALLLAGFREANNGPHPSAARGFSKLINHDPIDLPGIINCEVVSHSTCITIYDLRLAQPKNMYHVQ